jgi:transposase
MADKPYPTDLTDQQWELIRPLLEHNHGQRGMDSVASSTTVYGGSLMAASIFCGAVFRGA